MQNVVPFPRVHAHALGQSSRAANTVNRSEVTPADRAVSVDKIADHLSEGMLSRCHHFETAEDRAAISDARASFDGQSSITSLNDFISFAMPRRLGQLVLKRKDKVALDGKKFLGHTVRMSESDAEKQFKQEFIERVATARIATGKKQWQVAELLNVPQDHYKHWEKGRLMPHHLIGRFCLVTNVDPVWLMTGKGQKPLKPPHMVESEDAPEVAKPKRAKRSKAA
jgi:ribosome-binding protein aMBF1 (putative translation factor)